MKITRKELKRILNEVMNEKPTAAKESSEIRQDKLRSIIRDHNRIVEKKQNSAKSLLSLKEMIRDEVIRIAEGEVVDMFSADQTKQNAVERIARALAARAEEMLDADGDGDDIAVHVDHKLFLSPYTDIDGHRDEVQALAVSVYENYVSGKAGDQAESLDSIIERISIDYFDEDIEYVLEALGDDRFTMPHTYHDDDQMTKTKEMAAKQDPAEVEEMGMDFERFLQGIESGDVAEFPYDEDED